MADLCFVLWLIWWVSDLVGWVSLFLFYAVVCEVCGWWVSGLVINLWLLLVGWFWVCNVFSGGCCVCCLRFWIVCLADMSG